VLERLFDLGEPGRPRRGVRVIGQPQPAQYRQDVCARAPVPRRARGYSSVPSSDSAWT
jgi:hypothetical protein